MGDLDTLADNGKEAVAAVADAIDETVDENAWLERVTQVGWVAKAVVYTLMGVTALQVAQQDLPDAGASPEGSIGRIADAPLGRALLVVLTIGLLLYSARRLPGSSGGSDVVP